MRTISLIFCLLVVVLPSCSRTFNGYRGTPQMPAEILQLGPYPGEANGPRIKQTVAPPVDVFKPVSNSDTPSQPEMQPKIIQAGEIFDGEDEPALELVVAPSDYVKAVFNHSVISTGSLALPVSTAMPLQPTEYRRVWIAPHLNRFGDAIHGHYSEIVFREAAFKAPSRSRVPPSTPVLVKKGGGPSLPPARTSPSSASQAVATPNLQDYLQQMGIAQHGR